MLTQKALKTQHYATGVVMTVQEDGTIAVMFFNQPAEGALQKNFETILSMQKEELHCM
jgi:hypothetical protein